MFVSVYVCRKGREREEEERGKEGKFLVIFGVHTTPNFVMESEFITANHVHRSYERIGISQKINRKCFPDNISHVY